MIVQCPECQSRYRYDVERFERKPSRRLRCFSCSKVFEIINPAYATAPSVGDLDETGANRRLDVLERDTPEEDESEKPKRRRKRERTVERQITEGQPDGPPMIPAGYRFSLAVISGPDSGKVYRIEKPEIVIGRSNGDLALTDSETSRSHASITVYEQAIMLEDLESTNGTFHKGKPITDAVPLHNHSEFQIGNTTLMLIVTRE